MAHAILLPVAFVLFFPLGAMVMRITSFRGLVWLHAGWMISTYFIVLVGTGLGVVSIFVYHCWACLLTDHSGWLSSGIR